MHFFHLFIKCTSSLYSVSCASTHSGQAHVNLSGLTWSACYHCGTVQEPIGSSHRIKTLFNSYNLYFGFIIWLVVGGLLCFYKKLSLRSFLWVSLLLRQGSRAHLGLLWQQGWHPYCCFVASAQTHRKTHKHTLAHWNYSHKALSMTRGRETPFSV